MTAYTLYTSIQKWWRHQAHTHITEEEIKRLPNVACLLSCTHTWCYVVLQGTPILWWPCLVSSVSLATCVGRHVQSIARLHSLTKRQSMLEVNLLLKTWIQKDIWLQRTIHVVWPCIDNIASIYGMTLAVGWYLWYAFDTLYQPPRDG